jgi:hypothetical protein
VIIKRDYEFSDTGTRNVFHHTRLQSHKANARFASFLVSSRNHAISDPVIGFWIKRPGDTPMEGLRPHVDGAQELCKALLWTSSVLEQQPSKLILGLLMELYTRDLEEWMNKALGRDLEAHFLNHARSILKEVRIPKQTPFLSPLFF